jgi:hypothetical protein
MLGDSRFTKAQGPCWEGYEMIGYKTQNGKKVPNCVKIDSKKSSDNDDESGESHDKKKKKKLVKSDYTIVDSHPRCEGVALVETDGTNVLCYGSREAAHSALDGMNDDEEESSVRPNDMNKIWKGSGFETPRCCP